MPKPKVVMLISNDMRFDPRVPKEAWSAASIFDTTVLAFYRHNPKVKLPRIERVTQTYGGSRVTYKIQRFEYRPKKIFSRDPDNYDITRDRLAFLQGLFFFYELNKRFLEAAKKIKPDVVHANDLDTLVAAYLIKKKTGAKLVYDSHELWTNQGMPIPGIMIKMLGWAEKFILKRLDGMVSVNESIIRELEKMYHFKFSAPVEIVYNSPVTKKISLKKKNKKVLAVLYQGRFAPNRGLEELALAGRYIDKNIKIYFRAKDFPEIKEKIIMIIKQNKLEEKIELLEPVKMTEMVEAGEFADVGVIPYIPVHKDNELTTPNKLFEYMMSGCALACSDLPELKKIINKYQNGVLFNPREPKSIAKAINQLAKDRKVLTEMQKRSLKASKDYAWEHQGKKLTDLYLKTIHPNIVRK